MTKVNHSDEHPRRPYLLILDRRSDFIGQELHGMCENDCCKSVGHRHKKSTSKCSRGTCSLNNRKYHWSFNSKKILISIYQSKWSVERHSRSDDDRYAFYISCDSVRHAWSAGVNMIMNVQQYSKLNSYYCIVHKQDLILNLNTKLNLIWIQKSKLIREET